MTDEPVATPSSAWSPLRHSLFRGVWIATIVSLPPDEFELLNAR